MITTTDRTSWRTIGVLFLFFVATLAFSAANQERQPGSMPGYEGRLSDEELKAIVTEVRRLGGVVTPTPKEPFAFPPVEQQVSLEELGAEVFARSCATCHGRDGRSQTAFAREIRAPDLTSPRLQARVDDGALAAASVGGSGRMKGKEDRLTSRELSAVMAYVRGLRRPGPIEPEVLQPPPPAPVVEVAEDPARTYFENHCATCHGKDGKGSTRMGTLLSTVDLSDPKVQAKFTDDQCALVITEGLPHEMAAYKDRIDPALIAGLVQHVRSLARKPAP
jgi:mono/diheme cytochrome c family protein